VTPRRVRGVEGLFGKKKGSTSAQSSQSCVPSLLKLHSTFFVSLLVFFGSSLSPPLLLEEVLQALVQKQYTGHSEGGAEPTNYKPKFGCESSCRAAALPRSQKRLPHRQLHSDGASSVIHDGCGMRLRCKGAAAVARGARRRRRRMAIGVEMFG